MTFKAFSADSLALSHCPSFRKAMLTLFQATAELMQNFYQAYSTGTPAVLSLQQAQKKLLKTSEYRHPYYWAAFILTGAVQ